MTVVVVVTVVVTVVVKVKQSSQTIGRIIRVSPDRRSKGDITFFYAYRSLAMKCIMVDMMIRRYMCHYRP